MSNDVVQGLAVPLYYYIGRPPPLIRKNLVKWTIQEEIFSVMRILAELQSASCQIYLTGFIEVIEVLAVFKTNLYLAPFDESLSNLIIYINWIPLFIYYESA